MKVLPPSDKPVFGDFSGEKEGSAVFSLLGENCWLNSDKEQAALLSWNVPSNE
jgi:hypothetical protein